MTLLDSLVTDLMWRHPTPWTIDYDWLIEVVDSRGKIVLKLSDISAARSLISISERLAAEKLADSAEIERLIVDAET